MSKTVLRWLINIAGIICLYLFIVIRISPKMMNTVLQYKTFPEYEDATKYGELFLFSKILDFKKELKPAGKKYRFSDIHSTIHDADILTFGDSNFDNSRQKNIPERLHDNLNKQVFYYRFNKPYWGYPLSYLRANNYQNNSPKLLIYESAERNIHSRFINSHDREIFIKTEYNIVKCCLISIRDFLFNDKVECYYNYVLKRGYIISGINSLIATAKFKLTGNPPAITPKFYLNDEEFMLFYAESIDHFNNKYSDEEINTICDNMKFLATTLKEEYNIEFLFLSVPEKYTIYQQCFDYEKYNDFLPRIYEGLKERNINYIDLYSIYSNNPETIYYPGTDTHWNEKGIEVAYNKIYQFLERDTLLNYIK